METRARYGPRSVAIAALAWAVIACSGAPPDAPAGFDPAAGLAVVVAARRNLDGAWARLDAVRAELVRLDLGQGRTAAAADLRSRLRRELAAARAAFEAAYADDQASLTAYLAAAIAARPAAEETRSALALAAGGAERYARDLIARSGEYRRAIDLLETTREYFEEAGQPAPASLLDALATAREYRVLTRARFDRLATGMSPAEVKAVAGVPFEGNVHHTVVAGKEVTSWLYGSGDGGVAAVYFDDRSRLYAWKWNVLSE
jgi:hypothetical protein